MRALRAKIRTLGNVSQGGRARSRGVGPLGCCSGQTLRCGHPCPTSWVDLDEVMLRNGVMYPKGTAVVVPPLDSGRGRSGKVRAGWSRTPPCPPRDVNMPRSCNRATFLIDDPIALMTVMCTGVQDSSRWWSCIRAAIIRASGVEMLIGSCAEPLGPSTPECSVSIESASRWRMRSSRVPTFPRQLRTTTLALAVPVPLLGC